MVSNSTSSSSAGAGDAGLGPGDRAGIGVGAGLGGILLLVGAALIYARARRGRGAAEHDSRWWLGIGKAELDAGDKIRPELGGVPVSEMDGAPWEQQPAELAAGGENDDERAGSRTAERARQGDGGDSGGESDEDKLNTKSSPRRDGSDRAS